MRRGEGAAPPAAGTSGKPAGRGVDTAGLAAGDPAAGDPAAGIPARPDNVAGAVKPLGSLRGQLLRWLLIPLAFLVALDAVSVYRNALEAADLAYDRSLLASTRALADRVSISGGRVVADVPYVALDSFETDTLGRIYYKVTGIHHDFISGYADLPPLPRNAIRSDAYPALVYFYDADYRGEPVRIAALYHPVYDDSMRGITLVQVGESREARSDLSRKILFDTLWRQAALVLAAVALAWFAVRFVLRPLMQLKRDVEARPPTDLADFDAALVHREVRPLVEAMNGYMARLQALIAGQRRFIADASHQLRTPLTILKTQAELALRENDAQAMRSIVESIARTTDSTVHLANRLLTLARAGYGAAEGEMAPVSLTDIMQQAGLELAPAAVKKDIDLSLDANGKLVVTGNELLLHELVINLVDNAIRYTAPGGKVSLRVHAASAANDAIRGPAIEIEDTGPGIAATERDRVFEPFYRATTAQSVNPEGTGLGLSIVRDIAVMHKAELHLSDGTDGRGLRVVVQFPTA